MRLATIVVAALATSACVTKHPVQIASAPRPLGTVDSGAVLFSDSVVYTDLRRALARTDSLIKELKAKQRIDPAVVLFSDSLVYADLRRLLARTDSFIKEFRASQRK